MVSRHVLLRANISRGSGETSKVQGVEGKATLRKITLEKPGQEERDTISKVYSPENIRNEKKTLNKRGLAKRLMSYTEEEGKEEPLCCNRFSKPYKLRE